MKKLKKNWPIITLFGLFFLFLFIQHHFVYLYHDDYGYLSLSYEVTGITSSMNYGLKEIFSFLGQHYLLWGGRVVGFFYEILFGHIGKDVYWFFQSLCIVGTFVFIYLIATKTTKYRNITMALFTIFSYGLFEIMQLRSGIYWMTASCLYMVPLCFFLGFVYLHLLRDEIRFKNNLCRLFYFILEIILLFLGTYAQEQIAFAVLGYIFIISFVHFIKTKKVDYQEFVLCIISLMAFLLLMLAPGNAIRMSHPTSASFYALSFFEKFRRNIPEIVNGIFGNYYKYFTGMFFAVVTYCAYYNMKEKKEKKVFQLLNQFSFFLLLFLCMGQICFIESYFGHFTSFFGDHQFLLSLFMIVHLIVIGYTVILYLITKKEWTIFYLVIAAILSQGTMLVAPYYAGRCAIIFNVICFIFMINVLTHLKQDKQINLIYLLLPFLILTSFNMGDILLGYYRNAEVNIQNDLLLKEVSKEIKNGKDIQKIELQKLPDDLYALDMPYMEGFGYILPWIKNYYELPEHFEIFYREEDN